MGETARSAGRNGSGDGMRSELLALLALGAATFAPGAAADPALETYHLAGAIGPYPIRVSLTIKDDKAFDVGHYFYASRLQDIPLTGAIDGRSVTLQAPGGETFRLTLQGNGGPGGEGASFATSVGLDGTWTKGAEQLPVKLSGDFVTDGPPSRHMYADVTNASDAAFEALVRRFLKAVIAGDKPAAAAAVSYPLRVNGARTRMIRTPAALIARWNAVFTPALMAQLKTAAPHEMFVHNGQAMVSGGAVWFAARGASAINEP